MRKTTIFAQRSVVLLIMVMIVTSFPLTIYGTEANSKKIGNDETKLAQIQKYETVRTKKKSVTTKSVGTTIIKKAIKIILKNHKKAVPIIEKLGGKRAAKAFSKHFSKVAPQLRALLKWSDIPYKAVYDAVYRGLINAGVSRSTATSAAHALKEGLSWLL